MLSLFIASLYTALEPWRLMTCPPVLCKAPRDVEYKVAKEKKKRPAPKLYTPADIKSLKQHSKARTPLPKIAKQMKRTEGSLRQKAKKLGIGLGHQR